MNLHQSESSEEKGNAMANRLAFKEKVAREKELDNLRTGGILKGKEITTKSADEDPLRPTTTTETTHQSIKAGATRGTTIGPGGKKVRTYTGGKFSALEQKLNNPVSTADRPRLGMVARQAEVMDLARKAQPFMEKLEAGDDLGKSHYNKVNRPYSNATKPKSGQAKWQGGIMVHEAGNPAGATAGTPVHSYGMEEYGNRTTQSGGVERLLPELKNHPGGTQPDGSGTQSRTGVWSEADLNPREEDTSGTGSGVNKAKGRDAQRLLHTAANSKVEEQIGRSSTSTTPIPQKNIDHKYWVTGDHYKSAVPIAPVQKDYKLNHPYTPKYMDPTGQKTSLQLHQEKEDTRMRQDASDHAKASAQKRADKTNAMNELETQNKQKMAQQNQDDWVAAAHRRNKEREESTNAMLDRERQSKQEMAESNQKDWVSSAMARNKERETGTNAMLEKEAQTKKAMADANEKSNLESATTRNQEREHATNSMLAQEAQTKQSMAQANEKSNLESATTRNQEREHATNSMLAQEAQTKQSMADANEKSNLESATARNQEREHATNTMLTQESATKQATAQANQTKWVQDAMAANAKREDTENQ